MSLYHVFLYVTRADLASVEVSFLTGADSTWGLSNFIVSKGYRVKRRRKAYKGVEKIKEKAKNCKDNYRTISNFLAL